MSLPLAYSLKQQLSLPNKKEKQTQPPAVPAWGAGSPFLSFITTAIAKTTSHRGTGKQKNWGIAKLSSAALSHQWWSSLLFRRLLEQCSSTSRKLVLHSTLQLGLRWNNEESLKSQAVSVRQIPPRITICWTPRQVCPESLTRNKTQKHGGFKKNIYMNCRLPIKLPLSKSHSCLRQGGTSLSFIFISLMEHLIHWNYWNTN